VSDHTIPFGTSPEPNGPFAEPIALIHRGGDGFVSFHRKRNGEWEDLASIPSANLQTILPHIAHELERDSYFSINSYYRPGRDIGPVGFPSAHRKGRDARYLNACYLDVDVHLDGQSFDVGPLLGVVISAQDRKSIPPASLVCRSGRGLWLLWLLHQEQNLQLPPPAFPEQTCIYDAVQVELARRVQGTTGAQQPGGICFMFLRPAFA